MFDMVLPTIHQRGIGIGEHMTLRLCRNMACDQQHVFTPGLGKELKMEKGYVCRVGGSHTLLLCTLEINPVEGVL
jgi:hypothetical protein